MTAEASVEGLVDRGVVEVVDDGAAYGLTPSFVASVREYRATIEAADGVPQDVRERLPSGASFHDGVDDLDPTVLAEYCAALDRVGDERRAVATVAVLDRFRDPPRDEGSPSAFLPVRGERLPFLLGAYRAAVVYAWREDCPPCDVTCEDFEAIFDSPPEDLLLVSVYGPDCPVLLERRYDVVGAPTVLFVRDGAVDTRFVGARDRHVVEAEVETVRDLVRSSE